MATYSIQAPNGKTYEIDGPDGASQEDVQAEVLRQHPDAAGVPEPAAAPASDGLPRGMLQAAAAGATDWIPGINQAAAFVDSKLFNRPITAEQTRQRYAEAKAAHPAATTAGALASGVATSMYMPGGKYVAEAYKGGNLLTNALRTGLLAAPFAATTAANEAPKGERLNAAIKGGGLGLGLGTLGGLVMPLAIGGMTKLDDMVTRQFGGRVQNPAVGPVTSRLIEDDTAPDAIAARLRAANEQGTPMSIASVARPDGNVQGLARRTYTMPGPGRRIASGELDQQMEDLPAQIDKGLQRLVGGEIPDTIATAKGAELAQQRMNRVDYPAAFEQGGDISSPDTFRALTETPAFVDIHNEAVAASAKFGDINKVEPLYDASGRLLRHPGLRDIDIIKKGMDANVKAAASPLTEGSASAKAVAAEHAMPALKRLMDAVDSLPESQAYVQVRAAHAATAERIGAMETGRKLGAAVKPDPGLLSQAVGEADTPGAKRALLEGWADGVSLKLGGAQNRGNTANVVKSVMGGDDGTQAAAIRRMVPDIEAAENFIQQMRNLNRVANTNQFVRGGSQTANKAAEVADAVSDSAKDMVSGGIGHTIVGASRRGIDFVRSQLSKGSNERIAMELFKQRPADQADEFMRALDEAYAARLARPHTSQASARAAAVPLGILAGQSRQKK